MWLLSDLLCCSHKLSGYFKIDVTDGLFFIHICYGIMVKNFWNKRGNPFLIILLPLLAYYKLNVRQWGHITKINSCNYHHLITPWSCTINNVLQHCYTTLLASIFLAFKLWDKVRGVESEEHVGNKYMFTINTCFTGKTPINVIAEA